MSLSKYKSHHYATVQMALDYWLSSVSSKQCQMRAPVQIPPGPIFSNFFSLPVMLAKVVSHVLLNFGVLKI
jgi:hypothetical protein